jgi:RNA polymerase sigma factor (sigma-70 family)
MHGESLIATEFEAGRSSHTVLSRWDASVVTTAFGLSGELWMAEPIRSLDSDAALLFEVKSFLSCKTIRCRVPPSLQHAWDEFHRRYRPLMRRAVKACALATMPADEIDDLSQEVWEELVAKLPELAYDAGRGDLSSWLKTLARRKVRHLARCWMRHRSRHRSIESSEDCLPSQYPGPGEACLLKEIQEWLDGALAKLQWRTSPKTYEVFCRRFLGNQSGKEIVAALNITAKAVQRRYDRAARQWHFLTKDSPLSLYALPATRLPIYGGALGKSF